VAGCASDGETDLGEQVSFATSVSTTVTLKTTVGQQYVTAENAGGGDVHANRPVAQGWETFTLSDLNGGTLESGDLVTLAASDGHFVCAEGGGGGIVNATRTIPQDWETFRILKVGGVGTIHNGDSFALQTKTKGLFVSALNGGGGDVVADRAQILGWETFVLGTSGGGGGGSTTPPSTRLRITSRCAQPIWIAHSDNVSDTQNVRLDQGQSRDYQIPAGGVSAVRFWPKTGCDGSGHACAQGDSGEGGGKPCPATGCQAPLDSKFEATFAPVGGGAQTWYNLSQVDGYTLPFKVQPFGSGAEQNGCVSSDCSHLSLDGCPGDDDLSGGGAFPSYAHEDLRVRDAYGHVIACAAPCKKWNYPAPYGLGLPESQDPGLHLCCPTPIDPASGNCTVANGCMTSESCRNAADPRSVVHTDYVAALHAMCPSAYAFSYDDANGLHACPSDTSFEVTFCP
jgi:hypothetical protein